MMARELLGVYLEIFDSLLGHLTDRGYDGVLAQLVLVGHVAPPKQPSRKNIRYTHTLNVASQLVLAPIARWLNVYTDKKEIENFPHIEGNSEWSSYKVIYEEGLPNT
jgi:hypothetical protein